MTVAVDATAFYVNSLSLSVSQSERSSLSLSLWFPVKSSLEDQVITVGDKNCNLQEASGRYERTAIKNRHGSKPIDFISEPS